MTSHHYREHGPTLRRQPARLEDGSVYSYLFFRAHANQVHLPSVANHVLFM